MKIAIAFWRKQWLNFSAHHYYNYIHVYILFSLYFLTIFWAAFHALRVPSLLLILMNELFASIWIISDTCVNTRCSTYIDYADESQSFCYDMHNYTQENQAKNTVLYSYRFTTYGTSNKTPYYRRIFLFSGLYLEYYSSYHHFESLDWF